jgi:hypothetical protein
VDNVSFLLKHLNETVFQSGLSTLVDHKALHDTHYKNYNIKFESKQDSLELQFKLSYVLTAKFEPDNPLKLFQSKSVPKCLACSESTIEIMMEG